MSKSLDELAHAAAQAGHDALVAEENVRLWTERLQAAHSRRVEASNAYWLALQAESKPVGPAERDCLETDEAAD